MGGCVLVGIKRRDGSEHLYETWTNIIPWYLSDPEFLNDGSAVDEFIRTRQDIISEKDGLNIYTTELDHVRWSDYGVILIDLQRKIILSFQGYTTIGKPHIGFHQGVSQTHSDDETNMVKRLIKANRLIGVGLTLYKGEFVYKLDQTPEQEQELDQFGRRIMDECEASSDGRISEDISFTGYLIVDLNDFETKHSYECGDKEKEIVRDFLAGHWKAQIRE